jgi:hypothetical protein
MWFVSSFDLCGDFQALGQSRWHEPHDTCRRYFQGEREGESMISAGFAELQRTRKEHGRTVAESIGTALVVVAVAAAVPGAATGAAASSQW